MIGVYKMWFEGNDKVYIGSSRNINNRLRTHVKELLDGVHTNIHLTKDFRKYGLLYMRWEVVEVIESPSNQQLLSRESYYINLYKSNINGYNKASYASNRMAIKNNEVKYRDISYLAEEEEYVTEVNKFKSKHNINLVKIDKGVLFPLEKLMFSRSWFDKADEETLKRFVMDVYNYMKHYSGVSFRKILNIIPDYNTNPTLKESIKHSCDGGVNKSVCKLFDGKIKHNIKSIGVYSLLNPFYLEINDMKKKGTLDAYRVYSMIRLLEDVPLEKDIDICVPVCLFDIYSKYLS